MIYETAWQKRFKGNETCFDYYQAKELPISERRKNLKVYWHDHKVWVCVVIDGWKFFYLDEPGGWNFKTCYRMHRIRINP